MRYQDYVIKDGKFIGEFEQMYQDCDDPWHQSEECTRSYSRFDTVATIRRFGIQNLLEAGCGLGYFTEFLSMSCKGIDILGMDISPTAIKKARSLHPSLNFICGDLKNIDTVLNERNAIKPVEAVILPEMMWYILSDLRDILTKIKKHFGTQKGYLIVNQTFYKNGQQYGREFFTTQKEMAKYVNLEVLVQTKAMMSDNDISYETHTVFRI